MSDRFQKLIDFFAKLPGIGPRQATRLVLALLNWTEADLKEFASSIETLKDGTIFCERCFNFSDESLCQICSNSKRNKSKIAVVEKITDLTSMENTGVFDGVYHVLGGTINPVEGTTPEKVRIKELISRIKGLEDQDIEIIMALGHTTHGNTTTLYLEEELKPLGITITRLARGLAAGSTLEYADETTLSNALKERR